MFNMGIIGMGLAHYQKIIIRSLPFINIETKVKGFISGKLLMTKEKNHKLWLSYKVTSTHELPQ